MTAERMRGRREAQYWPVFSAAFGFIRFFRPDHKGEIGDSASTSEKASSGRLIALDGLRGMAALVVVIHHSALVLPSLAAAYRGSSLPSGTAWWLTRTPLHLFWNGPTFVNLFFVLSGYVLARPLVMGSAPRWLTYYPRRIARLYLPVAAAVALAVMWIWLVPRGGGSSWWVAAHGNASRSNILADLILISGPGTTNSVLWSLRWEVWFSLLLPAFILLGRLSRRMPIILSMGFLALLSGYFPDEPALRFMPVFGLGVLLAWTGQKEKPLRGPTSALLIVLVLCGMNATWLVPHQNLDLQTAARCMELFSATGLIWITLNMPATERFLSRGIPQWLGRRSFSLYLVHEPLLVSLALLGGRHPIALVLLAGIPGSALLAEVFYRLIEKPSIRFSHFLGRWPSWIGRLLRPSRAALVEPRDQAFLSEKEAARESWASLSSGPIDLSNADARSKS